MADLTLEQLIEARDLLNQKIEEKQKGDISNRKQYLALIFLYSGTFDSDDENYDDLEETFINLFIDEVEDFSLLQFYTTRHGYHTDHVQLRWLWDTYGIEYWVSEHCSDFYSSNYRKDGEIEKLLNKDTKESILLAREAPDFKERLKLFVTYHLFDDGIYELLNVDSVWIKNKV